MRPLLVLALIATPALAAKHPAAPDEKAKPKHPRGWPMPAAGPTMSGDPELIFTFDDGPNPKNTPIVLDALAKHHIHAIFFLVGERLVSKQAPELIARILREGHIIGTHTMHHLDQCHIKDDAKAAHDIDDGKAAIEKAAGIPTFWFRTPFGVRCERLENFLEERHLAHFHWDLDPQEWKHKNAKKAIAYVEKELGRMTTRQVLLMHDTKDATAQALPEILDWLDAENARRKESHRRRIRIIQGYELAAERLPAGWVDWLADAVSTFAL